MQVLLVVPSCCITIYNILISNTVHCTINSWFMDAYRHILPYSLVYPFFGGNVLEMHSSKNLPYELQI